MNEYDQQNFVSLRFMKITGFYQLINPQTPKHYGLNLFKVGAAIEFVFNMVIISMLIYCSYYYIQDTNELMSHFMLALAVLFSTVKFFYVRKNARLIWNCLEMTSVGFLSPERHDKRALREAQSWSITLSSMFIVFWSFVVVTWCLSPFYFRDIFMVIESNDGVYKLRYNVLNNVYPVTEQFYNDYFFVFYFFESTQVMIWGHLTTSYDSFVVSVCIAIAFQLRTIAESYSRICCKAKYANGNKAEAIFNLKLLIQDHQNLLKKIREIYQVFEPVIFVQLINQSMLIILQTYMIFINHYNGLSFMSVPIIKLFITVMPNVIHLFVTCYLYSQINYQKESMNFALYCSGWTEMSIDFKKLLLLIMRMNDAEKLKLKISMGKIVNLEMFASVMHTTYSIISVLAKSYGNTEKRTNMQSFN